MLFKEKYRLNRENIDRISEKLEEILNPKLNHREVIKTRISAEEILLQWLSSEEVDTISLEIVHRRKKILISMAAGNDQRIINSNPLKEGNELGYTEMADSVLANMGITWSYQYQDGNSRVYTNISTGQSNVVKQMILALILAGVTVAVMGMLPQPVSKGLEELFVTPFFELFLKMLSIIVGPMMLFSVIFGITSLGDAKQLGTIGKRIAFKYILYDTIGALIAVAAVILAYGVSFKNQNGGEGKLGDLLDMIYDIVPANFFTPFIEGNTMQIIFVAIVIGIAMVILQDSVGAVATFVEQANGIIQYILGGISKLVPGFVYLSVLRLALLGELGGMLDFVKMLLVFLAAYVVFLAWELVHTKRKLKLSIRKIIKYLAPGYLISLATASSSASYGMYEENGVENFGISKNFLNFAMPLGTVVMMPAFALWYVMVGAGCLAYCGKSLTPVSLTIICILAVFMAIASPPIPGGALTSFTLLLIQLGLPMELLAIVTTMNMLTDFPVTAGNVISTQLQLLVEAKESQFIDEKIMNRNLK